MVDNSLDCEYQYKIVVLDDDPTGIQTVHGCLLVTDWSDTSIREAFADDRNFFYILTNTRAMTRQNAERVTREAMETVVRVNRDYHYHLVVVSRSDSCLRGYFPLETDIMRQVLQENTYTLPEQTFFCPAFIEAGRVTIDGKHNMIDGEKLIPLSETEFARDNVFAYHSSVLKDYISEKGANPNDYVIVNAQSYDELNTFSASILSRTVRNYDAIVIRSSSSLPKALSGIEDIPLLDKSILASSDIPSLPLYIVGSHVKKTTVQLEKLLHQKGTCGIEVDVQRVLEEKEALLNETLSLISQVANEHLTPVVYTSRQEIRLEDKDKRQQLGQLVSDFLVELVRRRPYDPSYLVAKGGITSHDILTHGLGIRTARVLGQVVANVPCMMTPCGFPYIIFPGNVGSENSLSELYTKLTF